LSIVERINSALRRVPPWTLYVAGAAYIVWLFWLGATGGLGAEPINALQRELGQTGFKLLVIALAVTPLRRFAGLNLIRFRRALGLTVFMYISVHLMVWLVLDLQSFARVWADILKRPYITIGMVGFAMMIPLAITSNNLMVRKLGKSWRQLHMLTYVVVLLGGVHFVMVRKGFQMEPLVYLAIALALLATRVKWRKQVGRPVRPKEVAAPSAPVNNG
jgi:methionine sulfoxide reductase heme-binding subunit